MDFREYIKSEILKKSDRILEFGPLARPIASKEKFPNIYFADVRSTDDIKKLYTSNDYLESTGISVDLDSIVDVDYVITKSYKDTFKNEKKFDVVVLSHVIEHMPDLIFFFKDVVNILKKDGHLVIIYPDARYCFDHFRNGTTFIDAYDVYKNKSINGKAVFDFTYNVVHENAPAFFWNGKNIIDILPKNKFNDALQSYEKTFDNELPDDVHFWPFSDYQFVKFLYDMDRAGLLDFEISDFRETQQNNQEFMIVLSPKKGKLPKYSTYQKILSRISPAVKFSAALKEKQDADNNTAKYEALKKEYVKVASSLEQRISDLKKELKAVYSSKRWRLATKAANIMQAVLRRKHEDI